jgi:hypothetical protein
MEKDRSGILPVLSLNYQKGGRPIFGPSARNLSYL